MKRIDISQPRIKRQNDIVVLECPFKYAGKDFLIRNEFSSNAEDIIVTDRVDAVLVALLRLALVNGIDISSDIPISEELYYNIKYLFIDAIYGDNNHLKPIKINIPITEREIEHKKEIVATGISCGVDSLFTVNNHINCGKHSLTHLMYFDIGAHLTKELAQKRLELAVNFSKDINLPLITVNSNLPDIICEIGGGYNHVLYHTYMMASLILCMQGGIKYYYYSSTYSFNHFGLSITDDCAKHDLLLLNTFSINGTKIISTGGSVSRIDKIKVISNFPISYKYLNVCIANIKNDGLCFKCIRTLLELDAIGVLDKYHSVFDVDFYKKNRKYYLYRLYYRTKFVKDDYLMAEIYDYFKDEMTVMLKIKALIHLSLNRLLARRKI